MPNRTGVQKGQGKRFLERDVKSAARTNSKARWPFSRSDIMAVLMQLLGADTCGQQGRASCHSQCNPSGRLEGQGQGGGFDAAGQFDTIPHAELSPRSVGGFPTPRATTQRSSRLALRRRSYRISMSTRARRSPSRSRFNRSRAHARRLGVCRRGDRAVTSDVNK